MPVEQCHDLYNAGKSSRTGTFHANNAQMYGSPTLNSGGVSVSAGISGWHIPAIPCDAVLRREETHTRAPQKKKHLLPVTDTLCSSRAGAAATAGRAAVAAQAE